MVKKWSKSLLAMILIGGVSGITAVATTNRYLAMSILFVIFLLIMLYSLDKEGVITVNAEFPARAKAEEIVDFSLLVNAKGGFGFYVMEFPLPDAFLLKEDTNIHVFFKGFSAREKNFVFKAAGMRRGTFLLDRLNFTYYPAMGVINKKDGKITTGGEIEILPKVAIPNVKLRRMRSNENTPRNTISRIGPASSDFESVREYQTGDSYREINWKATARSAPSRIMVNQYLKEGEKTVLYLLDRSLTMSRGTTEENPLEYSISFIFAHSRTLMRENINTGFWTAQSGHGFHSPSVMPSSGVENENRFRRALLRVEPTGSNFVVYQVEPKFFTILRETSATVVLITSVWKENSAELANLVKRVRKYSRNIVLVNVISQGIIMKHLLTGIELFSGKRASLKLAHSYIERIPRTRRIDWDPSSESLGFVVTTLSRVIGI